MGNSRIEVMVGVFLIIGFLAFGWLALRLGEVSILTQGTTYTLDAAFNNVSCLKKGAEIQISGVNVGTVRDIRLDQDNMALVRMQLQQNVHLPLDSMASIKTQGIIGDKYIQISLGGDTTTLAVKIAVAPCHIASLPLAVNIQCHSARHEEVLL